MKKHNLNNLINKKEREKKKKKIEFEKSELINDLVYDIHQREKLYSIKEEDSSTNDKDMLRKYMIKYKNLSKEIFSNPVYSLELKEGLCFAALQYQIENYNDNYSFLKFRKKLMLYQR